jgi:hypothetical protein
MYKDPSGHHTYYDKGGKQVNDTGKGDDVYMFQKNNSSAPTKMENEAAVKKTAETNLQKAKDSAKTRVDPKAEKLLNTINNEIAKSDVQSGVNDANGNPGTWCNRAAERIAKEMGVDTKKLLNNNPFTQKPDMEWTDANSMAKNAAKASLNEKSGIINISPENAQKYANKGDVVFAAQDHTPIGHVGIVAPDKSTYDSKLGPLIGQAGSSNGVYHEKECFNKTPEVKYYLLKAGGKND